MHNVCDNLMNKMVILRQHCDFSTTRRAAATRGKTLKMLATNK